MLMKARTRISKGGQISIPAAIRRRCGTSTVALDDQGDRIVIEPAPDDPIAAAEGALAAEFGRIDVVELRRRAREDFLALAQVERVQTVELPGQG
jgi:AbrB family looped-hinge helix DNA binding protein